MDRRDFLKHSGLVAAGALCVPAFLRAQLETFASSKGFKRLVIVQLGGGNDGLNTVVPFSNDIYYQKRPSIALTKNDCLRLTDDLGFNSALVGLKELFDQGYLSIINGVGYPEPSHSHFRSMDIMQSASGSKEFMSSGWIGRWFERNDLKAHQVLELDATLSMTLKGEYRNGLAMEDAKALYKTVNDPFYQDLIAHHYAHEEESVSYLYQTLIDTDQAAEYIYEKTKVYQSSKTYPKSKFGKHLKEIAEFINSGLDTRVYYTSLNGFDTHVNQKTTQKRLLSQLGDGLSTFVNDIKEQDNFKDTLVMVFSEFGRRVSENGSNGTDHGTANSVYLIGQNLKKAGVYNDLPSLSNLDKDNLIFNLDYRQIYSEVLDKWLEGDTKGVISQKFSPLNII